MALKKTGNYKKREEYRQGLEDMYHTCRWCKRRDSADCPINGNDGEYNVYNVSEEGNLSDTIREVLEPLYQSFLEGMERDALMLLKPKGQVQSMFYQYREGQDSQIDHWIEELDEKISVLYQNSYNSYLEDKCPASVDTERHYCSLWE